MLAQAHEAAQAAAEVSFYEHLLGRRQAGSLKDQLAAAIAKEHKGKVTANVAESNTLCQALEMECTKQLAGGGLQVPSMYQFEGKHKACMKRFQVGDTPGVSGQDGMVGWRCVQGRASREAC